MDKRIFQLNEAKMFADITDGIAIIINAETGIYYGMNGFGSSLFKNLTSGIPAGEVLEAVLALPDVPEGFGESFGAFLDTLLAFEIIIPGGEPSGNAVETDAQTAGNDGFVPECKEYKDVQELLFADPIHEVDEAEGWTPE